MSRTTIDLHPPSIEGQDVVFHWTVEPPSDVYHSTSFRLSFPESIDPAAVPERLWWTVFLLCVHSHWVVMRPCTVRLPIDLPGEEIEFWHRLLETHVATAEAQRGGARFERDIDIVPGASPLDPLPPLEERGTFAAAFSGGKDSLVQAEILFELGHEPILVATTSVLPGLVDHGTSHRRRTFDEIRRRRGATLVEVESDLRSAWDNAGSTRQGYPFGINEIADTFLYTGVLLAVAYSMGATHVFLASENEVSQNHAESGRFLQHPHFMYSATTQAAIRALLAPAGMYFGSLISSLHSSQVQELLTTRYRDVRDLQFSCWRTSEERRACSECSECKRLGWVALSLGEPPSELGIDLVHLLNNYDTPELASRVHTYPPSAEVSERMHAQSAHAVASIPTRRVLALISREQPSALARPAGWRALARFRRLRREALAREDSAPTGYRAGYLETVDPDLRDGIAAIFDDHFDREPEEVYIDQLRRQRSAIEHITEPLKTVMEPDVATTDVIFVAGKDIIEEAGGHGSYLRTLTLAAVGAGYTPHIFCVGREAGVFDTPYGRIHRSASPLRWLIRHGPGEGFRTRFFPFHQRTVRRQIEKFLRGRSGAFIVHGTGPWGAIGVDVAERLSTSDRTIIPVVTIWSTTRDEHRGKRLGVSRQHGVVAWLRAQVEYRWMLTTVVPRDTRAMTRSARVLVNYESVARQVREIPDHAPIDILPYAAESAFDDPPSPRPRPAALASLEPADAPLILAVSRHDSRKGLDVLIAALGLLRERGIRFRACLVGPGPLLDVHRRLADGLGIGDSTAIVGYVTDPVAYLQHGDVFVLPSIQEASGSLSILEAMQAGLAIVASDLDGIPEDVTNGDSADLVPPGDAGALADALQRVLTDDARRERLGQRAREVFEERFTADRFSRSLGNLYRELLQEAEGSG